MENVELQENEIAFLKAMYLNDELIFYVPGSNASFILNLKLENNLIAKIDVTLPSNYPTECFPSVLIRCDDLNENKLNHSLQLFMAEQKVGDFFIFNIITWLKESFTNFKIDKKQFSLEKFKDCTPSFIRLWIYSHHIYSLTKRRKILTNARRFSLRGFCVIGKPGLIVVEGDKHCCDMFYGEIRSWNWQKLQLKLKQSSEEMSGQTNSEVEKAFTRLPKFNELTISVRGDKSGNDLRNYLKELGFEEMFFQIFLS